MKWVAGRMTRCSDMANYFQDGKLDLIETEIAPFDLPTAKSPA